MRDQLANGFIEKVDAAVPTQRTEHYLPHLCVKKDSPTTPVRVVFDCSAKSGSNGVSLNDCLYSGPSMLPEIPQMLMRFRLHEHAATADISKAYLRIGLDEADRDATRFLWPKDPADPNSAIEVYRFKAILFGATSSQFILNATIDHHLRSYREPSHVIEAIRRNIYVDNLLLTASTEENLVAMYQVGNQVFNDASLYLREWASNSTAVCRAASADGNADHRAAVPVLGLQWKVAEDVLQLAKPKERAAETTKRGILSHVASNFDPLGLMIPVNMKAKLIMQKIWTLTKDDGSKYDWDDSLPSELQEEWLATRREMHKAATEITIPRHSGLGTSMTIHTFVDASAKAYGAAVYGVSDGVSTLLMAKGRVAPKKALTIPKLELTAASLGARLTKYVCDTYAADVKIEGIYMWSDSQVALRWIASKEVLPAYVQNRKLEVQQAVPDARWDYVDTTENPADLITRPVSAQKLANSTLWWHGPRWTVAEQTVGKMCVVAETNVAATEEKTFMQKLADRYSTFREMVKTVAWLRRVKYKPKEPYLQEARDQLTYEEYKASHDLIIRAVQREAYPEEIKCLDSNQPGSSTPLVRALNLALRDGKLVVVSRLENAGVADSVKYPVLLPPKHKVTALIIASTHELKHHRGLNSVMSAIRQQYWIPRMRQVIKSVVKNCTICRRLTSPPYLKPPVPPLPAYRVDEARPFAATGVDYAGPFTTKRNAERDKRYVAVFTCAATRAVHFEIAENLSAEAFLRVLQRFVSRRSYPSILLSDNGSNFRNSAKILKEWEQHAGIRGFLGERHCQWRFNPSLSPWMGGFWERLIRILKDSLASVVGRALLTDDELHTVVCTIEAQMNDRPLTYVSNSPDDPPPLTPSQLMTGYRLDSVPVAIIDPEEDKDPTMFTREILTRRQKHMQKVLQHYFQRFKCEYLTALRQQASKCKDSKVPEVGDIVQVHDNTPRTRWELARITDLHKGKDDKVRSVTLRTGRGTITRPVTLLYPLELSAEGSRTSQDGPWAGPEVSDPVSAKDCHLSRRRLPGRRAAELAKQRLSDLAKQASSPFSGEGEDVENNSY